MINIFWAAGFVVGFLVVIVLSLLLGSIFKKKKQDKSERTQYDERQIAARGKAYKTALFTTFGYFIIAALIDVLGIKWAEISIVLFIGLFLSVGVFVVTALFSDAYFIDSQKNIGYPIIALLISLINGGISVMNIMDGESLITNGMLNIDSLNAVVCVSLFVVSVLMFIKIIIDKKAVENE